MSAISISCFILTGIIILSCMRRGADIFSPTRVFGLIWSIAIGLTDLKLSGLQHDWDFYAWITLLLGVASFLVGVLVVQVSSMNRRLLSIDHIRRRTKAEPLSGRNLYFIILVLSVGYIVAYAFEWAHYGVLPLFAQYPDRARGDIAVFGVHLIVNSMPIILFLIFQYLVFVPGQGKRKVLLGCIFLLTAASSFLLLNRLFYIFFLVMAIGTAFYSTKMVRLRNLILLVPVVIGALAYLQSFREARYAEHFFYVVSDMKYSEAYAVFTGPYMYFAMNLENFARAVVQLEHFAFGLFSFDFLMALTGLKHWISDYFRLREGVFLISGYNTFPFFWDYYYDFGLIGLVAMPGLLGAGIATLHKRMRESPTIQLVSLYSLAIFVMVISFFANILALLNFDFNLALLLLSQVAISRRSTKRIQARSSS